MVSIPGRCAMEDQKPAGNRGAACRKRSLYTRRDLDMLAQSSLSCPLRVISLLDYDAFFAQCETIRLNLAPTRPLAVRQWNAVIAVNYPARDFGVRRGMSVDEVTRLCPDIALPHVATWRPGSDDRWAYRSDVDGHLASDKAALDPYRRQSRKTIALIRSAFLAPPMPIVEKASVDEVFLDLSGPVHSLLLERYPQHLGVGESDLGPDGHLALPPPVRWPQDGTLVCASDQEGGREEEEGEEEEKEENCDWDDVALLIGSELVRDLRATLREQMHLTSSAGVAHNKAMAKLAAGLRKPNGQVVLRHCAAPSVLAPLKLSAINGLRGKLGARIAQVVGSDGVAAVQRLSLADLESSAALGARTGAWLYHLVRGRERGEVRARTDLQSMLAAKTFAPPIRDAASAQPWLRVFAADLASRIRDLDAEAAPGAPRRRPTTVALHHHVRGRFGPTRSKQTVIPARAEIREREILSAATKLLGLIEATAAAPGQTTTTTTWPCMGLSLSVSDFVTIPAESRVMRSFLRAEPPRRGRRPTMITTTTTTTTTNPAGRPQPDNCHGEGGRYRCPTCSSLIEEAAVLEHLDWHVALSYQGE